MFGNADLRHARATATLLHEAAGAFRSFAVTTFARNLQGSFLNFFADAEKKAPRPRTARRCNSPYKPTQVVSKLRVSRLVGRQKRLMINA
eukprot:6955613-Pyramimonas_sp.AAC.2